MRNLKKDLPIKRKFELTPPTTDSESESDCDHDPEIARIARSMAHAHLFKPKRTIREPKITIERTRSSCPANSPPLQISVIESSSDTDSSDEEIGTISSNQRRQDKLIRGIFSEKLLRRSSADTNTTPSAISDRGTSQPEFTDDASQDESGTVSYDH